MLYTINNIEDLLKQNSVRKLIFIHTPKCGGSYVSKILAHLNIINKAHTPAIKGEGINFTIIRNPVERFESLLNYRLNEEKPRRANGFNAKRFIRRPRRRGEPHQRITEEAE